MNREYPLHPDQKAGRAEDRLDQFCDALIKAADASGGGIKWRPFFSRAAVERSLLRCGYELCEECADHDPRLKRFFAMPLKTKTQPEFE